ncbi:radical SAM protein [Candidatus Sumerlaeota bacterium]|nr:radical SAM protein [Candidatus Sumerlaeota bacterium]
MKPLRKIFLIVPPTGKFIREDRCQTPIKDLKTVSLRPPIDLMYCASAFEAGGGECRVKDYPGEGHSWDELRNDLREWKPDGIVLSITTPSLVEDMQAAALAKEVDPEIVTMAKGAHFNVRDVDTLERYAALDLVFRGEYEETAMELARGETQLPQVKGITWRDENGEIIRNADRGYIEDLDKLPFPARHLVNNSLYRRPDNGELQTTLITNRGCPFSCSYCLAPMVGGKRNRYRSVENVIAEITECVEKYGIRSFLFRSDLFTQNKTWVKQLCEAIIERGLEIDWACNSRVDTIHEELLPLMKQAGCWIIAFGVESGVPETLEKINKKATAEQARAAIAMTKRAGIYTSVYMLLGLPWETERHIEENIRFFIELNADFYEIFYAYPFPGTAYHKQLVEEGLLDPDAIPVEAYGDPAHATKHFTREQLGHMRRRALRKIYMRPRYIIQTLKKSHSPAEALQYIKYGLIQLKDFIANR